jgi:hypothetical protein
MAKGRDHEIVRALETHPRLYHGEFILNFVWSWAFKCCVKTSVTNLSTECCFITIIFMWAVLHNKFYYIKGCEILECHGL